MSGKTYVAYLYPPEGGSEGGPVREGSLAECRAAVAQLLGKGWRGQRWDGTGDDVEAYHEHPEGHPRADGCGGVAIRPAA